MRFEDVCIPVSGVVVEPVRALAGAGGRHLEPRPRPPGDGRRARSGRASTGRSRSSCSGSPCRRRSRSTARRRSPHRLGLGHMSGPMLAQACATSVACVALGGREPAGRWRRRASRRRDRPDEQRPAPRLPEHERSRRDPGLRELGARQLRPRPGDRARRCSRRPSRSPPRGKIEKAELDDLAVRRYEQYLDALADDRAFQREWMVPIVAGSRRKPVEIAEDWGVRPIVREELEALAPVEEGGVVSYGTQTHPADGCAGMVVTTRADGRASSGIDGPGRAHPRRPASRGSSRGRCRRRPVPAARAALADAGIGIERRGGDQDAQPVRRQRRLVRARARRRRLRAEPVRLRASSTATRRRRPARAGSSS